MEPTSGKVAQQLETVMFLYSFDLFALIFLPKRTLSLPLTNTLQADLGFYSGVGKVDFVLFFILLLYAEATEACSVVGQTYQGTIYAMEVVDYRLASPGH